jgi:cytochrome d ubiquinol oxidase subunit I
LILFVLIYLMLFALFIYLLGRKIQHGPEAVAGAALGESDRA